MTASEQTTNRSLVVTIIIAVLSLLVSIFSTYSSDASVLNQRIRAVEVQQENDRSRLERIESKLDRLFEYTTGRRP